MARAGSENPDLAVLVAFEEISGSSHAAWGVSERPMLPGESVIHKIKNNTGSWPTEGSVRDPNRLQYPTLASSVHIQKKVIFFASQGCWADGHSPPVPDPNGRPESNREAIGGMRGVLESRIILINVALGGKGLA